MENPRQKTEDRRLILCALPYANNIPHVGNMVGSHLPADIFARFCRLKGYETVFIGGTDENGSPTEIASIQFGIEPQKLVDTFHQIHKTIYDWFQISYDNFSRTSNPIHHKTSKSFFTEIYKNGYMLEKEMKVPFCSKCSLSLPDRYVEGICPYCKYERARGDQCEKCTKLLDPEKLKKMKCKVCGSEPKMKKTKHLFLDLTKLQDQLEVWIKSNKHWRNQVTSLALGWIREGLKPRCITRDLRFGIKVPIQGYEDKLIYIWFEAPIGYVSSTKEWAEKIGTSDYWEVFWKNKTGDGSADPSQPSHTKIYNFLGLDNIPFHTIFWPGMLIAHGKYNLPYNVVGLQYCNYEGDKISKSRSWGVFCEKLPKSGIDVDVWRYYLSHLIPETKDSDFKWEEFQARVNNELIGNFGNFVNRTLSFISNYLDKKITHSELKPIDMDLIKKIENTHKEITQLFEEIRLREALQKILELSAEGNRYFQENKPWELVKTDRERCETVLYMGANLSLNLAILIQPFLPNTSKKIFNQLGLNPEKFSWPDANKINLPKTHTIRYSEILFKPIESEKIEELKNTVTVPTPFEEIFGRPAKKSPAEESIFPLDLKVGLIEKAEDHPNADKLYVLQINFGKEKRQIVSGLKAYYTKEELEKGKVVAVLNLKPATIRGVESKGMVLTGDQNGTIGLLTPKKSESGDQVLPENYISGKREIDIKEFSQIPLFVKDGKATFEGKPLKTKKETIEVDKVKEGKIG